MFRSKELKTNFRAADKDSKILNLVHPHQTGNILYNERMMHTRDFIKYRNQYAGYGKIKKKLDGIDGMASLYVLIFRYVTSGSFEPGKKRQFKDVLSTFSGKGWFR